MVKLVATPIYAAILGLLLIVLALGVVRLRMDRKVSLGSGGDDELEGRIRAHGNLTEYAPLILLLLGLFEINGGSVWLAHGVGAALVFGRIVHAWALPNYKSHAMGPKMRVLGMMLTFLSLAVISVANIVLVVMDGT